MEHVKKPVWYNNNYRIRKHGKHGKEPLGISRIMVINHSQPSIQIATPIPQSRHNNIPSDLRQCYRDLFLPNQDMF